MEQLPVLMTPQEVSQWTGLSIGALAQLGYKGREPCPISVAPRRGVLAHELRFWRLGVRRREHHRGVG